jgi:hypothetical protein
MATRTPEPPEHFSLLALLKTIAALAFPIQAAGT